MTAVSDGSRGSTAAVGSYFARSVARAASSPKWHAAPAAFAPASASSAKTGVANSAFAEVLAR